MNNMFFTITGCAYRYGLAVFKPGMTVTLVKEPDNKYDREAIRAILDGLGTVGYVANSPKTVRGTSMSAGRLYDKIPQTVDATVVYVLSDSVICSIEENQAAQPNPERFAEDSKDTSCLPDTADLDLYSQEDTSYLIPEETDDNETSTDSNDGEPLSPDLYGITRKVFEEPKYKADEEIKEKEIETDESTVSPEDIASALKAALAGLTIGQNPSEQEDPDAEYIYGYQTNEQPEPSSEEQNTDEFSTAGLAEKAKELLSGVSGLSAADFVSTLTGRTGSPAQQDDPSSPPAGSAATDTATDNPQDPEPSDSADHWQEEEVIIRAPGLNINTARFPEEEERDYTPARKASVPDTAVNASEVPEPEQTESDADIPVYEEISVPDISVQTPEEDVPSDSFPEDSSSLRTEETGSFSSGDSEEDTPVAGQSQEETDDEQDDLTKPLVFDESDLDENLAQLHLGDIDATYLSDSFLENLKKKLKESSS